MKRLRLGSMVGIPVRLDPTFLLALPVFAYIVGARIEETIGFLNSVLDAGLAPGALSTGMTPWLLGVMVALGLLAAVVVHELGHSVLTLRFGYPIDSITLWTFGGIASSTTVPRNRREELLIAAAGPLVSVVVGLGCYVGGALLPETFSTARFVLGSMAVLNVGLAAVNLLPGFPMDGGRVLRTVLARSRPYPHATRRAASAGKAIALLLGVVGVIRFELLLVAAAFLIYVGASTEVQQQLVENTFEGIRVRDIMTPAVDLDTVSPETCIVDLLERMFRQRHVGYPVVRNGAVVGMVTLTDLSAVGPVERDVLTVDDVMTTDLETISPDADVLDALADLHRHDIGRVLVTDGRDELVGLLTRTDLVRAFTIISQRDPPESEDVPSSSEPSPTVRLRR